MGQGGPRRRKAKARMLIPGWPRGRSTSVWSPDKVSDIAFAWLGRTSWYIKDFLEFQRDYLANAEYHARQAEMMDKHRSEYRRPTVAWLARKMLASGTGMVIATTGEQPGTIDLGEPGNDEWNFSPQTKRSA